MNEDESLPSNTSIIFSPRLKNDLKSKIDEQYDMSDHEEECADYSEDMKYDPYRIPADINEAQLHYECNRFGKPVYMHGERSIVPILKCPCCQQIKQEELPMDIPTENLVYFGPAIPLLFQLCKYLMILMLAYTPINIYLQYKMVAAHCAKKQLYQPDVACPRHFNDLVPAVDFEAVMLDFIVSAVYKPIVSIVILVIYYRNQYRLVTSIRQQLVSAADYSVMIIDLKPEQTSKEYLEKVLTKKMPEPPTIVKVCIATVDEARLEALQNAKDERAAVKKLDDKLESCKSEIEKKIYSRLKEAALKNAITIEKKWPKECRHNLNNSVAFVTLRTTKEAASVRQTSFLERYLRRFCVCFYKKCQHDITSAPYPEEVQWTAVGLSLSERGISNFSAILIRLICVGIAISSQYFLRLIFPHLLQVSLQDANGMIAKAYPLFSSFTIVIMNQVMILLANFIVDLEHHTTESGKLKSLTLKYLEFQFYNSVFGIYSSFGPRENPSNYGLPLVLTLFWEMIKSPWLDAYSLSYIAKKIIPRYLATRKLKDGKVYEITQNELNKLFKPPSIKLHTRYSSYLRTSATYLVYSSYAPIASVLLLGYLIHQFWMDKYMMLRRNKKTVVMSEKAAYLMAELLKFFVVFEAICIWYQLISADCLITDKGQRDQIIKFSQFIWAALVIAITMFPLRRTVASWTRLQEIDKAAASQEYGGTYVGLTSGVVMTDDTPYEHVWTDLVDDYDRLNPMTKHEAYSKWMAARDKLLHDDM